MSEWISVEDRLPGARQSVIVWCSGAECAGYAWMSMGGWMMPEPQAIGAETITHWMPLPEPPNDS